MRAVDDMPDIDLNASIILSVVPEAVRDELYFNIASLIYLFFYSEIDFRKISLSVKSLNNDICIEFDPLLAQNKSVVSPKTDIITALKQSIF